jgi:hypothetical protein
VRETGVHIADVNVVFANGRTVDVPVRSFIPEGGRSRVIDLPGKSRVIQRITLVYATRIGARDKALVDVWGLRDSRNHETVVGAALRAARAFLQRD